jgi:hypothetical protein
MFPIDTLLHNQHGGVKQDMSQVILEKPNNDKRRRTSLIGHSNTTRTNSYWPFAFSPPEDLTNAYLIENKKAAVLKKLELANEKLKSARREINEAVLAALEMKEAGDDIADQMLIAMTAQTDIKNAEITISQTQTKIIQEGLRKKDLNITQDGAHFEDRHCEAEKPLYLWRYE